MSESRKIKRLLSVVLATVCIAGALSGCSGDKPVPSSSAVAANSGNVSTPAKEGNKTPQDFEKFKIGVAEIQITDETVARRDYYENYIAPHYNVEFVFSESIQDAEGEVNFIENCADAGVDAIICVRGGSDAYQLAQIAGDYDMLYIYSGNREAAPEVFEADFDNFLGSYGIDIPSQAQAYRDDLKKTATDEGSEGFMILSGFASKGNIPHTEVTIAILQSLQEMYGLTYDTDIQELAITDAPLSVSNDKGLEIYVFPGQVQQDGWLAGVSSALQTGKYGFLISTIPGYAQTSVAVAEVEATFDVDIKVMTIGSLSDSLSTAFNTNDQFGNPSLDFVALTPASSKSAGLFAMTYNALTGYKDTMRGSDGKMSTFAFSQFYLTSPEQYNDMAGWDSSKSGKWTADYDYIDGMLAINNPSITHADIDSHLVEVSDFQYVYNRLKD